MLQPFVSPALVPPLGAGFGRAPVRGPALSLCLINAQMPQPSLVRRWLVELALAHGSQSAGAGVGKKSQRVGGEL